MLANLVDWMQNLARYGMPCAFATDSFGVFMRKIISLFCFLLPVLAFAGQSDNQIRSDAPDQYTVVKGDTLWDISGKFFKDPWKWPHIWGMNKETIANPHWIYPGQIIFLDREHGSLSIGRRLDDGTNADNVVRLSPEIISEKGRQDAIPSIASKVIEPFLSQPLVISNESLAGSPKLVGVPEERVIVGPGDVVYATGISENQGKVWQVFRPGKIFTDPDTHEVLGREAVYLGSIEINKFDHVSTGVVTEAKQEINVGDLLVAPSAPTPLTYLPRAPETKINATVISIYGGVTQAGQDSIITLNRGARDGLQNGNVLAVYSKGRIVNDDGKPLQLPDVRSGLIFVFRVFDKVSYALVMNTRMPVQLMDKASTP